MVFCTYNLLKFHFFKKYLDSFLELYSDIYQWKTAGKFVLIYLFFKLIKFL